MSTLSKKEDSMIKDLLTAVFLVFAFLALFAISSFAADAVPAATTDVVVLQTGGFTITSPMETSAVGFWFPGDGTFAAGIAHTVLRARHEAVPKLHLDIDGVIAQEVNQDKDTLAGVGFKLAYESNVTKAGFTFEPSLGLTALNNFAKWKTADDILRNYRVAVYGSLLLYKW